MSIVLLDHQGLAQDFPDQQSADQALASGTHTIPLVSPDGAPMGVPAAEREESLQKGYQLPTPEQLQKLLDHANFGSMGQAALAGIEGAGETLSLGTSGAIERALGVPPESQRKRAEQNPIAHGVGEVVGAVAPALLGDEAGAVNVLGKVGGAAEAGAKALTSGEGLATKLAGWAGRGAAESGLLTGEHVLNERLLGDPNATAEHALADIGLSTVLGGAGGAIVGKAAETGGQIAKKIFGAGSEVIENLKRLKDNAPEIEEAASRLGVEALPGQLSASRQVQHLQSQIAKEPTIVGTREQAKVDQQFAAIRGAVGDALGNASGMTKAEAGDVIKAGVRQAVEESYRPLEAMYAFIKEHSVQVPLDQEELGRVAKLIPEIEGASKRPGSPEGTFTKRLGESLPLQETVEDLRKLRISVGNEANPRTRPELRHYAGAVQQMLDDLEEKSLTNHLSTLVAEGKLPQETATSLSITRSAAKEGYRELMTTLGEVAEATGKRRIYGVKHFLDHLEDVSSEKLVDKLYAKGNTRFLEFLKEKFPEQARVLSQYQKSAIAEKAFKDGMIFPGAALREVEKLEPEIQRFLFSGEDLQKLSDAATLIDAMPKDINPSGTAKSLTWGEALNPMRHAPEALAGEIAGGPLGAAAGVALGIAGPEVSSLLKRSLLRGLVSGTPEEVARHGMLGKLLESSQRTATAVSRGAKAVFSRTAGERLRQSSEERDATAASASELAGDPQKLVDRMSTITEGLSEHAPDTTAALSVTAARAVQFLASKAPPPPFQVSPFSPQVPPSAFARGKFQRYAETVLDPVSVMSRVSDGTLTLQDLEALHTVYPRLYESMRMAVASEMADAAAKKQHVSYATRLGLSLFLGHAVDRTILPSSIASVQEKFAAAQPPPSAQTGMKRGTATLSKVGPQSLTPEQAAAARRSNPRS
jgi:hypothetical protein